jgi:hypothetical protein
LNNKLQALKYIVFDFVAAAIAWALFFRFRKLYLEPSKFGYEVPLTIDDSFVYGLLFIPTAWLLLYASTGWLLNPMIAGAAMALSSVSVVTNSLLLKRKKL